MECEVEEVTSCNQSKQYLDHAHWLRAKWEQTTRMWNNGQPNKDLSSKQIRQQGHYEKHYSSLLIKRAQRLCQ